MGSFVTVKVGLVLKTCVRAAMLPHSVCNVYDRFGLHRIKRDLIYAMFLHQKHSLSNTLDRSEEPKSELQSLRRI